MAAVREATPDAISDACQSATDIRSLAGSVISPPRVCRLGFHKDAVTEYTRVTRFPQAAHCSFGELFGQLIAQNPDDAGFLDQLHGGSAKEHQVLAQMADDVVSELGGKVHQDVVTGPDHAGEAVGAALGRRRCRSRGAIRGYLVQVLAELALEKLVGARAADPHNHPVVENRPATIG